MSDKVRETKAAQRDRAAEADHNYESNGLEYIEDAKGRYPKSEYLTLNIANGDELTLKQLRKRYPRIKILKCKNYEILGDKLSIYRIDKKKMTLKTARRG
jgi:hypothetical protein